MKSRMGKSYLHWDKFVSRPKTCTFNKKKHVIFTPVLELFEVPRPAFLALLILLMLPDTLCVFCSTVSGSQSDKFVIS
jgi:hypothetical protein